MSVEEDFAELLALVRSVADDPAVPCNTERAKKKRARYAESVVKLAERRRVWAQEHES